MPHESGYTQDKTVLWRDFSIPKLSHND